MYKREQLFDELVVDEAFRSRPYYDTKGKLTVGIGRNLTDKGISRAEAEYLCANDVQEAEDDLDRHVPWWRQMPEPCQRGLVNMCFNMGWPVLSDFHTTLGHLAAGRYAAAGDSCLQSKWARQVGERAQRIAQLFRGAI